MLRRLPCVTHLVVSAHVRWVLKRIMFGHLAHFRLVFVQTTRSMAENQAQRLLFLLQASRRPKHAGRLVRIDNPAVEAIPQVVLQLRWRR